MTNDYKFMIYRAAGEDIAVKAVIKGESLWLTQKAMAELFGCTPDNISLHLKNIFATGELAESATAEEISAVQPEGARQVRRTSKFYNLDAIISVGYRVNSRRATQFRIWATGVLREYIVKGFILDDERLKQGQAAFGQDYFRELLERVRAIRASERRVWQKVTDIFAECSVDYDKNAEVTRGFYAMVQNKFHYAITGKTGAEIVYDGADRRKDHMGLQTWKGAPDSRVHKSDVTVAKNYLSEGDVRRLERTVSSFFDYIENLTERGNTFTMEDFAASIDKFLTFQEFRVLKDRGRVSRAQAIEKAEAEYEAWGPTQKIISDFDRQTRQMLAEGQGLAKTREAVTA